MSNGQSIPQNPQISPQLAKIKNPQGADILQVEMPGEGIVYRLNQFQSPVYTGVGAPTGTLPASPCSGALYLATDTGALYLFGTTWTQIATIPSVNPQNTPAILHEFLNSYDASTGLFGQAQPAFTDISGIATVTQGGTGSNLSGTGGTSQVLQQTTVGGAVTVGQLAASDLSNGVTGSGAVVLATSPTLTTPTIGAATATSINKVAITAPATSATLTILNGKTLTVDNSLEFAGTDATKMTFPGTSDTVVTLSATQTLTNKTLTTPAIGSGGATFAGTTGTTTVKASATASGTLTLPAATDTLIGKATTDILTNKTFDTAGSGNVFKINGVQVSAVTGTGSNVLATSPTLVSPVLGNATVTSLAGAGNQKSVVTSTSTFTIPAGVTQMKVTVVGGGAAGGGGTSTNNGGGGGAGGYAVKWLTGLTPGNTLAVTVGANATGVSGAQGNAGTGTSVASGTQTISTISVSGGTGGFSLAATSPGAAGAAAGTGGDINYGGSGGTLGTGGIGGASGGSFFGGGAPGAAGSNVAGNPGIAPGAGGSGGTAGGSNLGGTGQAGVVIFEWIS